MKLCENCRFYRLKKVEDRKRGFRGYCIRESLRVLAKGYLVDMMYRYAEVPLNGLCDCWESKDDNG